MAAVAPEAMGRCQTISVIQSSAARQIDAAGYALGRMALELRSVMVVPVPVPARVATVHKLEPLLRAEREKLWQKVVAA